MANTKIVTFVLLAATQAAMCSSNCSRICYPSEFFPSIKGNLTKIVWAHAVNNRTELEKALSSEDIMMLEADVILGKLNDNTNSTDIPVMAHPPATESDLSLEEFINSVTNSSNSNSSNSNKGIKLDFKTNEAFESSKPILAKLRSTLKYPVFLNADILVGPGNDTAVPLNPKEFLKGANDTLPEAVLSVGWTTRNRKEFNNTESRYTKEQITKMSGTVAENRVTQPVTYPVRATFAVNSADVIKPLLDKKNSTLTIWSPEGEHVDPAKLSQLIKDLGIDKVYVDVPKDVRSKLNLSGASTMTPAMMLNLGASLALLLLSRML